MRRVLTAILVIAAFVPPPALRAQTDPESRRAAIDAIYPVMIAAMEAKNFGRARNICEQAIIWEPQNPVHHYNLACIEAQTGGARLSIAMSELELAITLGFDDALHLKNDPDLESLHGDPKFVELVRKATLNETAIDAISSIAIPQTPSKPASAAIPAVEFEKPAPPAFEDGVPVGLYFMTRFRPSTRTLEKSVWHFAPDGTVFQNPETGFSKDDLAVHAGPKGKVRSAGGTALEATWSDGKKVTSNVERDGSGFTWDMGIFSAAKAFEAASDIVGVYEGGEALSTTGGSAAVLKRLELRADGTFVWNGVSFVGARSEFSTLSVENEGATKGRWQLSGFSLILTDERGAVLRRIVFPFADKEAPVKPDRIFFGRWIYKKL